MDLHSWILSLCTFSSFVAAISFNSQLTPLDTGFLQSQNITIASVANTSIGLLPARPVHVEFTAVPGYHLIDVTYIHAFLFRRRRHDRHSHQGNTDKLYGGFNQYEISEPRYQLVLQPIWAPEYGTERQLTYGEAPSVLDQISNYLFRAGRIGLTVFEVVTYSTRGHLVVIARGFMREAQTLPLLHAIPRDRRYH